MKNLYKYQCNQLILRKTTNNSLKSHCLTIMCTVDNPLTAATIAKEVG